MPRSAAASGGAAAKSRRLAAKASPVDFDRVRAIVTQDLAPLATRIDLEGYYPESVLRALGAAGAYAAHVGAADGEGHLWDGVRAMALVAEECGATAFCMWCQDACAWYLAVTPNESLRAHYLAPVARGEQLGGTALSNPMKAFAGIEPIRLKGKKVAGGYRVSGQVPFVSNLGHGHVFGAIFGADDGSHVMALLDTGMTGIKSGQRAQFVALDGTRTWAVALHDCFVPDARVLAAPAESLVPKIRPTFILLQNGLAIGLMRDCLAMIRRAARSLGHVNRFLPEQAEPIAEALEQLERETESLCATPLATDRDYLRRVLQSRIDAGDWAIKAAHAAMLHLGARGYVRTARAQRRLREAYFVAILTPAGKHLRKDLAALAD
ncbi:MAG TPA: acyl-CoA dehydrogenase family protein [Stellaceae bacterium]|nr:acyl-CoA dehydrogenase family protein [Stellaceae bacterium]